MDITKTNFKGCLPVIQSAITDCDFISIDAEFTGINVPGSAINGLDLPEERYEKCRKVVESYLVLQYGVCTFSWDQKESRYTVKPFNFYLFPSQFGRQMPERTFSCQSSSIQFLVTNGYDFNKTFKEGINYLLPEDESKLREALEEKHRSKDAQKLSSPSFTSPLGGDPNSSKAGQAQSEVPSEHKDFINGVCEQIDAFKSSEKTEMALEPCFGYRRKLLYMTVAKKYPEDIQLETRTNEKGKRYLVVSKATNPDEQKLKEALSRTAEFEEIENAAGFSKVIQMISKSGKLVVGHNMLLDLLFTIHHFVNPLPQDYEEFKALVNCVFPRLIDNKHFANSEHFKEFVSGCSGLEELQSRITTAPFEKCQSSIVFPEGFRSYQSVTDKNHEAGYDAYITGQVFTTLSNYLGSTKNKESVVLLPNSQLLEPFVNKLHLMRVYDVPYMNLSGEDVKVDRGHVFHVTFPSHWKTQDITGLFSPAGNVRIIWLDDVSAFVSLYIRENTNTVLKSIRPHVTNCRVIPYEDYVNTKKRRSLENRGQRPFSGGTPSRSLPASDLDLPTKEKRRRSRSSESKTSPYSTNRGITTIVEETEEDELKLTEDIGSPVSRKRRVDTAEQSESSPLDLSSGPRTKKLRTDKNTTASGAGAFTEGLFEVPGTWD